MGFSHRHGGLAGTRARPEHGLFNLEIGVEGILWEETDMLQGCE